MKLKIFQIDAFTSEVFKGNPAAVVPLDTWLSDDLMMKIASENNLSETAFFVEEKGAFGLRWFTPTTEVDLCGHATLATAFVLANELKYSLQTFIFNTKSGELKVTRSGTGFTLDFPAQEPLMGEVPQSLLGALGLQSGLVLVSQDYFVVVESESIVRSLQPNFSALHGLPKRGVIVTAPSESIDFVSRWFGPNVGVNEDPVTGSAHCALTPYWSKRLDKKLLRASQISDRGGELICEYLGSRVLITGSAVRYMAGEIEIL